MYKNNGESVMEKKKKSIAPIPVKEEKKLAKPIAKPLEEKPKRGRPRKESEVTEKPSIIAIPVKQIEDKPKRGRPKKEEEKRPVEKTIPDFKIKEEVKPLTKPVKKAEPKAKEKSKPVIVSKQVSKVLHQPPVFKKSPEVEVKPEPKPIEPAPVFKPTVKYSDEDLNLFESRILEVRHEAIDELRMLRERLDDLTNYDFAEESMIYSMHMAEQGSEAMEKEKTYAQIQRINEYIKKLDDALLRIKDKTYGICRVCNCLIAKERLLAVPVTTLSASYKIHKRCPEDGIDKIEPVPAQ